MACETIEAEHERETETDRAMFEKFPTANIPQWERGTGLSTTFDLEERSESSDKIVNRVESDDVKAECQDKGGSLSVCSANASTITA